MALEKAIISIPMSLGVDTENAAPLISNDRFSFLSNVVFNKDNKGQLHKRAGHNPVATQIQGGGTLPASQLIAMYGQELNTVAGGNLYSYSTSTANWKLRGTPPMIQPTETNIAAGAFSVANPDACAIGSLAFYSFEMNGSSWVKVADDSNKSIKATINLSTVAGVTLYAPKLLVNGANVLAIATTATGDAWFVTINGTTLATSAHDTTKSFDVSPGSNETCFDATINGGFVYVVGIQSSSLVGLSFNSTTLAFVASAVLSAVATSPVIAPAPVSVTSVNTLVYVVWQIASTATVAPGTVQVGSYTGSGFAFNSQAVVTGNVPACPRITSGSVMSGGSPTFVAFYEQAPTTANVLSAVYYYISSSPILWSTGTSIAGQPFGVSGNIYLPVIFQSKVQQTLFLTFQVITGTPTAGLAQVAGRYYTQNDAGAPSSNYRIAAPFSVTSTTASLAVMVQPQGSSAATVAASLAELSLKFSVNAQFSQLGGDLHLACGSQLMDYDGTNLVEHNFHVYPETPSISYLTSQLAVIQDVYDPTCATVGGSQSTIRIAIPDNFVSPGGPAGQYVTAGEYIVFGATSIFTNTPGSGVPYVTPLIIYFTVNGNGSAPTGTGISNIIPCAIQSTMTASQIATALTAAINGSTIAFAFTTTFTAVPQANTWTPQFVKMIGVATGGQTPPAIAPPNLSRYSTASQDYIGVSAGNKMIASISFPPASLIGSGQYVTFETESGHFGGNKATTYVWFSNTANAVVGNENKTGGDPQPFGPLPNSTTLGGFNVTSGAAGQPYIGVEVILAAADQGTDVALKVNNALAAIQATFYAAGFAAGQVGNATIIQASVSSPILSPNYPTTNVGLGYVGANPTGTAAPGYAAIEYSAVAEWIDSQNQLHQSAPSVPAIAYIPFYSTAVPVNLPVSAVVQVAIQPISLTQKTAALTGTEIDFAIYRTISGATVSNQVFYRITPTNQLLFNQPTSLSAVTYADFSADGVGAGALAVGSAATGVQANQLIYTTGNVQPNSAPPACSYVINHQNRLWLAGLENPSELWYSEVFDQTAGQAVEFTQEQYALVNPTVGQTSGGPIVALASMDSNLIIFQQNQIWYIQGAGPDATGGNGFFTPPQIVASSSQIGCRDVNSVVLMPNGVMFKSTQGFWLLGRDLQLRYVGAAVKTFNSDVVTSAVALTSNSQINFLSSSGTTLMYDWYYDSWTTFTTTGLDSVIDGFGLFNMVTSSGAIWVQVPGQYIDGDGSPVTMTIQTAWLKPQNIQGFQRIWKAFLEGQFYGIQSYLVQVAYNYNATVVDSFTLNPGAGGAVGFWGGSTTLGAETWGEDGAPTVTYQDQIQIKVYPSNQLCESIQFTIQDLPPAPFNETWSLNALDLEIGTRRGGMKRIGNPKSLG